MGCRLCATIEKTDNPDVDLNRVYLSRQFYCFTNLAIRFVLLALACLIAATAVAADNASSDTWANPDLSFYGKLPIELKLGLKIDQITNVDQKAENFGAVGNLRLEWIDSNLTFLPRSDELPVRRYERTEFENKANQENIFSPSILLYNQQGRRFSEDTGFVIFPEGKVVYGERFTATLQAPDFNFEDYPFDVQRFFVAIDTSWPESFMHFIPDAKYSGLGDQLGEEEWIFAQQGVEVTTRKSIFGQQSSRIIFKFSAHRHIWYYTLRIFVPLLIILTVSWATFFLRDFSKRVDISAGNLLVYVAFNFTISNDLPRLGYLTFMDTIMAATFVITGLAVVWNVVLRRLQIVGKERAARVMDMYTLWTYPVAFILVFYFSLAHFFPDLNLGSVLGLG